ncbi:histidine phosphatase family protein [Mycolicibacterium obuense]|nr:histidine phosphatase family protein [Mycolicibacterium obuense]
MEVVLVRHGSSATSADTPMLAGHSDPNLSAQGEVQAGILAEVLGRRDPSRTVLFVTPLRRTAQTAEPTAAVLGATPTVLGELREVCLGTFEGLEFEKRSQAGDPLLQRVFDEQRWDVLPGAESMAAFTQRVSAGMAMVLNGVPALSTAIVFTHGGVIAEACRQVTGSQPFAFVAVENGSLTRFTVEAGGRWRLRSFNDTAHLTVGPSPVDR